MAAVCCAGDWLLTSSSQFIAAVNIRDSREAFVFDCAKAGQRPKDTENENKSDGGSSEEKGSDRVLACTLSASGNYAAVTDDNKRLILFCTQPSWECISTRWVLRRCTSLAFSQAEDELLVADKSGDVYSFSILEPQKQGELKLGHLSMLLALALSPDNKYIITADRDEKIRVSLYRTPYNIQAFCLGHTEFVSALFVPAGHPEWLLSGSGDGTLKLWQYKTGRRLQSFDLKELCFSQSSDTDTEKRFAVSRIVGSPDGRHVAVQCERFPSIQMYEVREGSEVLLSPSDKLVLPHTPWDVAFDSQGRLWVLLQNKDTSVLLFTYTQEHWQSESESTDLQRVAEALHTHWDIFKGDGSSKITDDSVGMDSHFQHLYKTNIDNMASYLQKKQARLQQQEQKGKKRTGSITPQSNGAEKRNKTERKNELVPPSCS